jgi:hypothetical protein
MENPNLSILPSLTFRSLKKDQRLYKQRSRHKVTTNWEKPSKTSQLLMKRVSTWRMS